MVMIQYLPYIKAIHIIFVVSWFAGLFFIGRLFVYNKELENSNENAALKLIESGQKRVQFIIIFPAMVISLISGLTMAHLLNAHTQGWFHIKFTLIFLLMGYSFHCNSIRKKIKKQYL